jgi:hypothetical protein
MKGPITLRPYKVHGRGAEFKADPRDVNGLYGCKGFRDWPGCEVL